ncbi:autophagy-related protein 2 homolog A-like isoform X2 [Watersipora subatra]|uniref:autophagy-related protein 2 homolog A-like isoform X2 n=1 Tax=Watersipora subatra TaxID=2589382 RepID=UPI00355BC8C1
MAWYYNSFADGIKKRLCRYALQSLLGEYLLDDVSIDQLTLDIYNGTGIIHSLNFNVQAVNKALAKASIPLHLVEGFIGSITVSVPWKSLINDDTHLEIDGLEASFQYSPCETPNPEFDPSWLSQSQMSASMQMAEECLKDDKDVRSTPDGLKNATKTIESVISRVRLTLRNTILRIENCPVGTDQGQAVELHIGRLEFSDDSTADGGSTDLPANSVKNINISEGLTMYTDTFLPCHRGASSQSEKYSTLSSDIFSSALSSQSQISPILRQPSYVSASSGAEGLPQEKSCLNSKPIKFLSVIGELKTKISIKNEDSAPGPKMKVDVQLNSLGVFLSPSQVHLLSDLVNAASDSVKSTSEQRVDVTADSYEPPYQNTYSKQWGGDADFHIPSRLLSVDQLDLEELKLGEIDTMSVESAMFQSVKGRDSNTDIMTSSMYSYSGSLGTTTAPSTAMPFGSEVPSHPEVRTRSAPKIKPQKKFDETKVQETVAKAAIAYLTFVLLNENPRPTIGDPLQKTETEVEKLQKLSDRFFDDYTSHLARGITSLPQMRDDVEQCCGANHIKLLVKSIHADVKQKSHHKTRRKQSELMATVTMNSCELTEWIKAEENIKKAFPAFNQQETSRILEFSRSAGETQPCVRLTFSSFTSQSSQKKSPETASNITIELGRECHVEVDISITDRLKDLLTFDTAVEQFSPKSTYTSLTSSPLKVDEPKPSNTVSLKVQSEADLVLHLRFPIADLRTDPKQEHQWWTRKLRQEVLEFHISKPSCSLPLAGGDAGLDLEFTCRSARAIFVMGIDRVAIANIGQECIDSSEGLEWPRVVVKTRPVKVNSELEDGHPDSFDSMQDGPFSEIPVSELSPFSGKKAMYSQNEELKIPGNKRETTDFEHITSENTELYLHIDLPAVNVVIPSQKVLEVLYNRMCNDLLLWESLIPVPSASTHSHKLGYDVDHRLNDASLLLGYNYLPCHSTFMETRTTDDESDNEDDMLYSIHDKGNKNNTAYSRKAVPQYGQSKACVSINIRRGRLTLVHPTRNLDKSLLPAYHGMSILHIQDGVIYVNSKSMGNPNLNFISIHSGQCTLYHDGRVAGAYTHPNHIERLSATQPSLPVVLTLCSNSVPNKLGYSVGSTGDEDMLGVAIKVALDPDPKKHIKNIVVSVSLKRACLQHAMVNTPDMWIIQLMDALALVDYDVLGYTFPQVHTELHFHVIGSAISYIPKSLPYACLLTLEKFSVSSNVLVNSPMSLLTFLLEDAVFYLSDSQRKDALHVGKDYVQLAALNYFKLDWKNSDGKNPKYPKTDIECKLTKVCLDTCADSIRALQDFIIYVAENGDMPPDDSLLDASSATLADLKSSLAESLTEDLMDPVLEAPLEEEKRLPALMLDAMKDPTPPVTKRGEQEKTVIPQDTFLFPDETLDGGNREYPSDSDDSFEILEKPTMPTGGNPVIGTYEAEPCVVKENYFPEVVRKVDLLMPPKKFPDAVARYCLADLNLKWNIYGGRDFGSKRAKGSVKGRDETRRIQFSLSKVQGHYEVYPETACQASRECLLVENVEIIDIVKASAINLLLYRYSSQKRPIQNYTGMICQKLVNHRPDVRRPERQEADVRVSIQPIRVNIDQDTAEFFETFINDLTSREEEMVASFQAFNAASETVTINQLPPPITQNSPDDTPIMTMSYSARRKAEEGKAVFDELAEEGDVSPIASNSAAPTIYIRNFVFTPEVLIILDYVPKRIDMDQNITGVVKGLTSLRNANIRLKALKWNRGILGVDKLLQFCINEWQKDIARSQIPSIIGGIGPLSSFVTLYQGLADLIWMPIEQYHKDGRVVRGLQRGANSFSSSTSIAMLEITNRLIVAIQGMAELSYDLLSPDKPPSHRLRHKNSQPRDIREGANDALQILAEGLRDTANDLYGAAASCRDRSLAAQVGSLAVAIPKTLIRPFSTTTIATGKLVDGMINQHNPDAYKDSQAKYK